MDIIKISDFADVITGGTPSTSNSEYWDNGDIPWLQSGVCQNCVIEECNTFITQAGLDNSAAKMMKADSVLIALTGATTGKVGYLTFDACANQSITGIQPNDLFVSKYLFYFLISRRKKILTDSYGGAQKHISQGYVKSILFPMRPKEEQKEIVNILEAVEKAIVNRKLQIEQLDILIKARFVEMFGDPLLNPNKYEVKRIDEIAELIKGITYAPEQVCDDGIIVLRSSNIKGSKFDLEDLVRVSKNIPPDKLVKENDILMCNRNGSANLVGKVAKIPIYSENMTFGTFMTIVRSVYFEYLFAFFQMKAFREQIKFKTAVAINQISLPLLAGVQVPLPPKTLIDNFSDFIKQVDKSRFAIQKSLDEAQLLFDSLMQEYFG